MAFDILRRPSAISLETSSVPCITSYRPPKSGYSFFSVLKQCGQFVTILFTP
jgi:hypothetical protein